MYLSLILKTLGWIFVIVPVATFFFVSISLIKGAATDDPMIGFIVKLFGISFAVGAMLLFATHVSQLIT